MIIELFGAFIVTFLGVSISFYLSKKQEREKGENDEKKIISGGLKLIVSELDLNKAILDQIIGGLETLPNDVTKLWDNYKMLIKHSKSLKTNVFYSLVSSEAMKEISRNDEVFNVIQQAYYNQELASNGLIISQEVFKEYKDVNPSSIPQHFVEIAQNLVQKELDKIRRTRKMVITAEATLINQLKEKGITFRIEKEEE